MKDNLLAVISDVHGNRWALEAVLRDIEHRKIQRIVNLGDSFYGPLDPGGTARILVELDLPTVGGNEDRVILEQSDLHQLSSTLGHVRDNLSGNHIKWLEALEKVKTAFDSFLLCHGSPEQDNEYLLVEVSAKGVHLRRTKDLEDRLSSIDQPVLLCGHDHIPRTLYLPSGKLLVNPGSVGLPAYADGCPYPHVMETGTPHARYSIVCRTEAGWQVENMAVPYDWETAAAVAGRNGRLDWAKWLAAGRASSG